MIAALIPKTAVGNTAPIIFPDEQRRSTEKVASDSVLLTANLNSLALDYVARIKVQSTHLNWYMVEQLPIIPSTAYERSIGKRKIGQLVREEVLHLTYTALDMRPFAEDLGYDGDPFPWNEQDRRHRRARLDAIFFCLYGIDESDATYILDTFPIMREQDESAFGRYRTKEMIVAYMRAFAVGDTETHVVL